MPELAASPHTQPHHVSGCALATPNLPRAITGAPRVQKAMLASLQQFAQDVQECGGLQQIGTVAGLVDSCGGAENVDANLGLLREVTELAQGPQNLADSLTGPWDSVLRRRTSLPISTMGYVLSAQHGQQDITPSLSCPYVAVTVRRAVLMRPARNASLVQACEKPSQRRGRPPSWSTSCKL